MALIQAAGYMLGMGSGVYVSRCLGNQDEERAEVFSSTAFFTAVGIGLVFAVFGVLFCEELVFLLGATKTIAPYAQDYAICILIASPFMMASFVLNNVLRSQGNAIYGMVGIATGGILNIILDPLLIFGLDMGISGAGVATMSSQMVSFCILYYQSNIRKGGLPVRISKVHLNRDILGSILHAGLPSLCRQGISSVAVISLNLVAGPYGDAVISALSIVNRIMMFVSSVVIGFLQGFQPVCGFNYGAKRYDRVLESYYFCIRVTFIFLMCATVVMFVCSEPLITMFRREDAQVIAVGTTAMRLQLLALPLLPWIMIISMLAQSFGLGYRASVLAIARQGIFFIPSLFILLGIQLTQLFADIFTFILSIVMGKTIINDLKEGARNQK